MNLLIAFLISSSTFFVENIYEMPEVWVDDNKIILHATGDFGVNGMNSFYFSYKGKPWKIEFIGEPPPPTKWLADDELEEKIDEIEKQQEEVRKKNEEAEKEDTTIHDTTPYIDIFPEDCVYDLGVDRLAPVIDSLRKLSKADSDIINIVNRIINSVKKFNLYTFILLQLQILLILFIIHLIIRKQTKGEKK